MIVPDQQGRSAASRENGLGQGSFAKAKRARRPQVRRGNGCHLCFGLVREISQLRLGELTRQLGRIIKTGLIRHNIDTPWFFIAKAGRLC